MRWSRHPLPALWKPCRDEGRRRIWSPAIQLTALLIAVVCSATLATGSPARAQDNASPATGHAQVIAHGVVPVPGTEIAWRVLSRDAVAEDVVAETGFLLAERGVVLLINQTTDEAFRIAPGMVLLTRGGDGEERTNFGVGAARYYAIELVLASDPVADDDAGPSYTSDPFPGPNARHAISLVRDVLADGELTEVPAGTAPTLVLATAGTIDVATAPGQTPVRLAAGQAVVMGGTLSVAANAGPATFVAAVIGPEVTLPSSQTTPATGARGVSR